MANLTVTIDDEVLRRARLRAMSQGTSVNALVRDFLAAYAGEAATAAALDALRTIAADGIGSSGERGRDWRRDDLYGDRGTGRHGP